MPRQPQMNTKSIPGVFTVVLLEVQIRSGYSMFFMGFHGILICVGHLNPV